MQLNERAKEKEQAKAKEQKRKEEKVFKLVTICYFILASMLSI